MAPFTDRYLNFYRDQKPPAKTAFLWPVWGWEILAPKPGGVRLNLFQRSILGLMHHGKTDRHQIAEWLGIEEDMVAYIIAGQLIPNGWMGADGALTTAGRRLLEKDVDARNDLTTAYVFQDALSDQWWPRVAQELAYVEPEYHKANGQPVFVKDKNTGKELIPYVIPCSNKEPPALDFQAMWESVQQGNNAIHNQKVRDELEYIHREFRADEIECIDNRPFRAYVLCWIKDDSVLHWTVTDPLAVERQGEFLRPAVFEAAKNNRTFANLLRDYLGEVQEDETVEDWNNRVEADTEFQRWTDFPGADRVPYLVALLRREIQVKTNGNNPWHAGDWDDLKIQCQKVLECCFKWMLDEWPLTHRRVIDYNWHFDDIYNALHAIVGTIVSDDVLQNLSRQKPGSLIRAAKEKDTSLRPLIAACLFTLPKHDQHPLFNFTPAELALDTILVIAEARNKASHASGTTISCDEALTYAQFTKKWVSSFLNGIKK